MKAARAPRAYVLAPGLGSVLCMDDRPAKNREVTTTASYMVNGPAIMRGLSTFDDADAMRGLAQALELQIRDLQAARASILEEADRIAGATGATRGDQ